MSTSNDRKRRWLDVTAGAVSMYLVSGAIVSTSMAVHTNGPCPWWLWPYWTLTWMGQVVGAIFDKVL